MSKDGLIYRLLSSHTSTVLINTPFSIFERRHLASIPAGVWVIVFRICRLGVLAMAISRAVIACSFFEVNAV